MAFQGLRLKTPYIATPVSSIMQTMQEYIGYPGGDVLRLQVPQTTVDRLLNDAYSTSIIVFALVALSGMLGEPSTHLRYVELRDWLSKRMIRGQKPMEHIAGCLLHRGLDDGKRPDLGAEAMPLPCQGALGISLAGRKDHVLAKPLLESAVDNFVRLELSSTMDVELVTLSTELVKCHNALGNKLDPMSPPSWLSRYNVPWHKRLDEVYLSIAVADNLIGQGNYESSQDILRKVLRMSNLSPYIVVTVNLRLNKICRRLGGLNARSLGQGSVIYNAVSLLGQIDHDLRRECAAELVATVSQFKQTEPKHSDFTDTALKLATAELTRDKAFDGDYRLEVLKAFERGIYGLDRYFAETQQLHRSEDGIDLAPSENLDDAVILPSKVSARIGGKKALSLMPPLKFLKQVQDKLQREKYDLRGRGRAPMMSSSNVVGKDIVNSDPILVPFAHDAVSSDDPWAKRNVLVLGKPCSIISRLFLMIRADGEGVQGFATLLVLQMLMEEIADIEQNTTPSSSSSSSPLASVEPLNNTYTLLESAARTQYLPCHYFDYIVGMRSGGLVQIEPDDFGFSASNFR